MKRKGHDFASSLKHLLVVKDLVFPLGSNRFLDVVALKNCGLDVIWQHVGSKSEVRKTISIILRLHRTTSYIAVMVRFPCFASAFYFVQGDKQRLIKDGYDRK